VKATVVEAAAVVVASARSVGSAPHRQAIAAEESFWSHRHPAAAGMARDGVRSAAPDVEEGPVGASPDRAVDYPCRANQAARGVAAASLARFCLMSSVSADIVGLRTMTRMRSDIGDSPTLAA
jgi:hypothetical protein